MKVTIDLVDDLINTVLAEVKTLQESGFKFKTFEDWREKELARLNKACDSKENLGLTVTPEERNPDENTLRERFRLKQVYSYANLRERIPDRSPRRILRSSQFFCPPEHAVGLAAVEAKIRRGANLFPHLSRQIFDPDIQDGMLFDFGIFHLHLGLTPDKKRPLLIQGTKDIVYCVFDTDIAYFLTIDDHGRWADLDLLRIIKQDFPELMARWELNIISLEHDTTEEERLQLRKAGVSTFIELDGVYYMPPGGGFNSAGGSSDAVQKMQKTIRHYRSVEEQILKLLTNSEKDFQASLPHPIEELSLKMIDPEQYIFADEAHQVRLQAIVDRQTWFVSGIEKI